MNGHGFGSGIIVLVNEIAKDSNFYLYVHVNPD